MNQRYRTEGGRSLGNGALIKHRGASVTQFELGLNETTLVFLGAPVVLDSGAPADISINARGCQ
jgi:hypothetical protein